MLGSPPPLEKRTVARTGSPCMCAARVSPAAAGVAVNVPAQSVPLACAARCPAMGAGDVVDRVDRLLGERIGHGRTILSEAEKTSV